MKKKIIISMLVISCVSIGSISFYLNKSGEKTLQSSQEIVTVNKNNVKADITLLKDLKSLKDKSDLIIEAVGTSKQEKRDYKGISSIITTVHVTNVFKGDKNLKEVKVIQMENVDVPPENGQKLVMFLMKGNGTDNPDCYGVVGAGQGIYIVDATAKKSTNLLSKDSNNMSNVVLKPQAIKNENILKELTGNYNDSKNKLTN